MSVGRRRLLLICPPFFTYHLAIRAALEDDGWDVTWWSDRVTEFFAYKIAMRLVPRVVAWWSTAHYLAKLAAQGSFERVLVVKGEGISTRVIDSIRKASPTSWMSLYLWDGIENVRNARRTAPLFDSVATFDPIDARRFGWRHRPLFAGSVQPLGHPIVAAYDWDWAFVGTLHSDRHRVLHRLRKVNPELRGYVRAFVPGTPMLVGRMLTDWTLALAPRGTVRTKPMPIDEVRGVVARARAVVDIEHPQQRGLTMRTIEALLSGKKLITTNQHILESDLYHPSRVHVISRTRPVVPPEFLEIPFLPIPDAISLRYWLREWVRDVLGGPTAGGYDSSRSSAAIG